MPAVALDTFLAAAEAFTAGVEIACSDGAIALAEASLEAHGLLLLGEFHGVAENPLIVEAVADAFEIDALAFEWPAGDERRLLEDALAWVGDGRVTAGHIALLRRTTCRVTGVDRGLTEGRDEAMAAAIARLRGRVLFVGGNIHTRLTPFHGAPTAGSILAAARPALCTLDIHYRSGRYWNFGPRSFANPEPPPPGPHVTLAVATEATVLGGAAATRPPAGAGSDRGA
jgi:hypothetical protein